LFDQKHLRFNYHLLGGISGFLDLIDAILYGWQFAQSFRLMGTWDISHEKIKWGLFCHAIWPGVMHILGNWQPGDPIGVLVIYVYAEELF